MTLIRPLKGSFKISIPAILLLVATVCFIQMASPPASAADDLEERYLETRKNFLALEKSPQRLLRQNWQPILDQFKQFYKMYPDTPTGEKSMFMVGRVYLTLYPWSGSAADLDQAVDHFTRFLNHYPQSPLADDAQFKLAEIQFRYRKNPERGRELAQELLAKYPQGDMRKKTEELLAQEPKESRPQEPAAPVLPTEVKNDTPAPEDVKGGPPAAGDPKPLPLVTGLRHWTTPDYTRIVVDVGEKISFKQRLLKKDPTIEKPQRLYLDLYPARLGKGVKDPITIEDGLLRSARAGQYDLSTVRIVLDIESIKGYKVFSLENPFRIIVDVTGKEKEKGKEEKGVAAVPEPPARDLKLSLAQQLGLGIKRVVIDAGHGGKDKGAIGEGALYEKDLTLLLARKLAQRVRQELKVQTVLTRDSDRFLPLEERTAIANTKQADLFISIHINASPNPLAQGFETYFLNLASDEESIRVAARENATSTKRMGDLQKILKDLMLNTKIDESSRLAHQVQNHLVETVNGKFGPVKNLGVKQAPFYVLIGAQMPSILVETSFISNAQERERLLQEEYQDHIVDGICKGIERYVRETKLGWEQPEVPAGRAARK
ncbi:MAG: N-acetylmuramoyl-L-alanine amidase [Deltaproteobacteria bacterium]|nr:N-acetylmuramoyl-L-alanine amidase [Deltaproteobacteria bacterium]